MKIVKTIKIEGEALARLRPLFEEQERIRVELQALSARAQAVHADLWAAVDEMYPEGADKPRSVDETYFRDTGTVFLRQHEAQEEAPEWLRDSIEGLFSGEPPTKVRH